MKYLIAGLGNPGDKYAHTRHNIGFDVLDAFVEDRGAVFQADRLAEVANCKVKGRNLILIKPMTFMNLSGKAVKYWMDKEKIPVERMLVVVDDLALPLDTLRLRAGGSDAGHNGLKSIQELINTNRYPRLRFGIGNDYAKGRQVDFVLNKWETEEIPVVTKKITASVELIQSFVFAGIQNTMNRFNHLKFSDQP